VILKPKELEPDRKLIWDDIEEAKLN